MYCVCCVCCVLCVCCAVLYVLSVVFCVCVLCCVCEVGSLTETSRMGSSTGTHTRPVFGCMQNGLFSKWFNCEGVEGFEGLERFADVER